MHVPIRVSGTSRTDLRRPPLLSGVEALEEWRVAGRLAFCRARHGLEHGAHRGQPRLGAGSLFGYPPRPAHYQYEEATPEAVNRRGGCGVTCATYRASLMSAPPGSAAPHNRTEEHKSELQSRQKL